MKTLILYHRADLDGVLSGVIAKFYIGMRNEDVHCQGCDYHDDVSDVLEIMSKYDEIYVIDFSHDVIFKSEHANKIIWIDHHKSAIEKYSGDNRPSFKDVFCIDGVAACRLALQYLTNLGNYAFLTKSDFVHRKVTEPLMVALAGEFDIWDKASPLGEAFNLGITDLSFNNVDQIFKDVKGLLACESKDNDEWILSNMKIGDYQKNPKQISPAKLILQIVKRGRGVLDYIKSTSSRMAKVNIIINGFKGRAFNTNIFSSLIHKLESDEDFTMVWSHIGGMMVKVSFYSDKLDVTQFVIPLGGGGHKGAAGATIDMVTLGKILSK